MYRRFRTPSIWQEMDQLQREMNRLFDRKSRGGVVTAPNYPAINIWMNDDGQVISAEMPGVDPKDINIDVNADAISISGERKPDVGIEGVDYHRHERGYGSFSRTIQLPFMVDTEKVEANFKNGVLTVNLPRAEADKPKKVTIQSS